MDRDIQSSNTKKSLYGVSGWLIVFVVFLVLNLIYTAAQGLIYTSDLLLPLITLVFTIPIMVFLFTKKIVFRLLFVTMMAIDLGFCLMHIFRLEPFSVIAYRPGNIVLLLACLAKLLTVTIYLYRSNRVFNTFEKKKYTLSGGTAAFLIFIISFLVVNIISLIETLVFTDRAIILFNQIPYISNVMAYVFSIILSIVIFVLLFKRKTAFRPAFIIMMLLQLSLLIMVFSYFGKGIFRAYWLESGSLPINVTTQGAFAFWSVVIFSIIIFNSKSIKDDFGILRI